VITPSRLTALRYVACLSKRDLAELAGVQPSTVARWEQGASPAEGQVEQLAQIFGVSPEFFYLDPIEPTYPRWYRGRSRIKVPLKKKLEWASALYRELVEVVDPEHSASARCQIPDVSELDPVLAAREVRQALGLTSWEPIMNLVGLLEARAGVSVHEVHEDETKKIDAFSFFAVDLPVVVLNPAKGDPYRRRFDCGHELGHLARDRSRGVETTPEGVKQQEREADQFSSEFLVPVDVWADEAPRDDKTNPYSYLKGKGKWGVSAAVLIRSSYNAGVLSEREYRAAQVRYSKLGWRSRGEPKPRRDLTMVHHESPKDHVLHERDSAELCEMVGWGSAALVEVARGRATSLPVQEPTRTKPPEPQLSLLMGGAAK